MNATNQIRTKPSVPENGAIGCRGARPARRRTRPSRPAARRPRPHRAGADRPRLAAAAAAALGATPRRRWRSDLHPLARPRARDHDRRPRDVDQPASARTARRPQPSARTGARPLDSLKRRAIMAGIVPPPDCRMCGLNGLQRAEDDRHRDRLAQRAARGPASSRRSIPPAPNGSTTARTIPQRVAPSASAPSLLGRRRLGEDLAHDRGRDRDHHQRDDEAGDERRGGEELLGDLEDGDDPERQVLVQPLADRRRPAAAGRRSPTGRRPGWARRRVPRRPRSAAAAGAGARSRR